jgi:hypothetical protein
MDRQTGGSIASYSGKNEHSANYSGCCIYRVSQIKDKAVDQDDLNQHKADSQAAEIKEGP